MTPFFAVPAAAALTFALVAASSHRLMRPSIAVPLMTALAAFTVLATSAAVALVTLGWIGEEAAVTRLTGWCRHLYGSHRTVPAWAGVTAAVTLVTMGSAAARTQRRRRRAVRGPRLQTGELEVLPIDQPLAFAVPSRPGYIVVSAGMLALLDDEERQVLLAHERAHLRRGHHRYLGVADAAAAALPLLRPVAARVRFGTERWADEDAAHEVGDRMLVACAIARAALAETGSDHEPAMALANLGVAARVEALLGGPRPGRTSELMFAAGAGATASSFFSSYWQVHHVASYALHFCRV